MRTGSMARWERSIRGVEWAMVGVIKLWRAVGIIKAVGQK